MLTRYICRPRYIGQAIRNSLDFSFLSPVEPILPETWCTQRAEYGYIIFEGDAWTIGHGPAIVGPRNERQFFQPRTMRRISALCRPIPLCSVMRHARIVIDARARFPFHFCATGPSHYSGKSTDNIIENRARVSNFVARYACTDLE